jgi:hypothetical protein
MSPLTEQIHSSAPDKHRSTRSMTTAVEVLAAASRGLRSPAVASPAPVEVVAEAAPLFSRLLKRRKCFTQLERVAPELVENASTDGRVGIRRAGRHGDSTVQARHLPQTSRLPLR